MVKGIAARRRRLAERGSAQAKNGIGTPWRGGASTRVGKRGRRSDDLVEVVRCRECKHYYTGMFCEKWADLHPHAEEYPMVGSDGYCHYGEKE